MRADILDRFDVVTVGDRLVLNRNVMRTHELEVVVVEMLSVKKSLRGSVLRHKTTQKGSTWFVSRPDRP